jgi:hypothetical protein
MIASCYGDTEALALLLAKGAIVNAAGQVMQTVFTLIYEFDRFTSQNLSVSRTRFAFEFRMGILLLCSLHKMGTLRLLRCY